MASSNRKLSESKKARAKAQQKQTKTKMNAVNKMLKFVILQQVNVISLLSLQIVATIENYQYSDMGILRMIGVDCISKLDKLNRKRKQI